MRSTPGYAPITTLDDALDAPGAHRARRVRRLGVLVLVIPVALAVAGVFGGAPTGTTRAIGDGAVLEVAYPRATRSSVATPLTITVTRPGGFGTSPVMLEIDTALMDRLDFQNWYPNPSDETAGDTRVAYEFDPPDGDVLEVHLDARTGPNQGFSRSRYRIAVVDGDRVLAESSFRMYVWP